MTQPTDAGRHWTDVYRTRRSQEVSWYQADPATSAELITQHSDPTQDIVDVGAGASVLIDALLNAGYVRPCALDLAASALLASQARLGPAADRVDWIVADVLRWRPQRRFDLWHDRAVFHFMTDEGDRRRYRETLALALRSRAVAVIGTFGPDGPERCSGLTVCRYSAADLADQFADGFTMVAHRDELHTTPSGVTQSFTWVVLARTG